MAVENCNISEFVFFAEPGTEVEAGIAELTITPINGASFIAEDFKIGNASLVAGAWEGGNVSDNVEKVVFSNNVNATIKVEVYHSSFIVTAAGNDDIYIDVDLVQRVVRGCTNPEALNYNPNATFDNGTCLFLDDGIVIGCTDPNAVNYNPEADEDDGSCYYIEDPVEDLQEFDVILHFANGRDSVKLLDENGNDLQIPMDGETANYPGEGGIISIQGTTFMPNHSRMNGQILAHQFSNFDIGSEWMDNLVQPLNNPPIGVDTNLKRTATVRISNTNWQMSWNDGGNDASITGQMFAKVRFETLGYTDPDNFNIVDGFPPPYFQTSNVHIPQLQGEDLVLQGNRNVYEYAIGEQEYVPVSPNNPNNTGLVAFTVFLYHFPPLLNPAIPDDVPSDWPTVGNVSANYGGGPIIIFDLQTRAQGIVPIGSSTDAIEDISWEIPSNDVLQQAPLVVTASIGSTYDIEVVELETGKTYDFDEQRFTDGSTPKSIVQESRKQTFFVNVPKIADTNSVEYYDLKITPTGTTSFKNIEEAKFNKRVANRGTVTLSLTATSTDNASRFTFPSAVTISDLALKEPRNETTDFLGRTAFSFAIPFSAGGGKTSIATSRVFAPRDLTFPTSIEEAAAGYEQAPAFIDEKGDLRRDAIARLENVTSTLSGSSDGSTLTITGDFVAEFMGTEDQAFTIDIDNFITLS